VPESACFLAKIKAGTTGSLSYRVCAPDELIELRHTNTTIVRTLTAYLPHCVDHAYLTSRCVMKTSKLHSSLALLAIAPLVTGCASIISGRHADVAFDTYPTNAHVTIHDNEGRTVASLDTPGVVTLKRNRKFFLPARYTATIEAPGYAPAEVPIRSTVNPWVLGNIVIGGIPGLIVDNATGAAWKPCDSHVCSQLCPMDGNNPGVMYSQNQPPLPTAIQPPQYLANQPDQPPARIAQVPRDPISR
jgi:hypothetical protein